MQACLHCIHPFIKPLTAHTHTVLSTCLGEPLKRFISERWSALLAYADAQPPHHRNRRARTRFYHPSPLMASRGGGGAGGYVRLSDEGYEMATLQKEEERWREDRRR